MSTAVPRSRDQRPCDACRKRKIRCLFGSDDAVNCVLCISRSTECTYVENASIKKRRLSTSAEKAQGSSKSNVRLKSSNDNDSVLRDYSVLKGNTLLKETLGHQNRQSSSVMGYTSDFDSTAVRLLPHNPKGECLVPFGGAVLRRPNHAIYFTMRPDTQDEMDREIANLDEVESIVAPYGAELVNLYFRIMHPSFPILHKKVFLEKHGRSYRESTPTGLGSVYLMALNWWSYSPALSSKPKPDANRLEKAVRGMLFDVHRRPKISDLQGGLVLSQQNSTNSWAMTGYLVAMSQNLGINLDCSDWQVPSWEKGVRKRVAWAVYMQDKWGALVHGRPSNIKSEDWSVPALDISDFPETSKDDDDEEGSAEIEKGRQIFINMVGLTQIVSDILQRFYTLEAMQSQDPFPTILEKAKPIQMRLKHWYSNLPSSLSIDDTKPRRLSSVGYLHLAYYAAEITIHRAILRAHSYADPNTELSSIIRQAASARFTHALNLVKRLKQEHFQSFWYFSSSISLAIIGVFAGMLAATSLDEAERKSYMDLLAEYRWILRISSTGGSVTKHGVKVLDANQQLLEQQADKPTQSWSVDRDFSAGTTAFSPDEWLGTPVFGATVLELSNLQDVLSVDNYDNNNFLLF